jgi:long-chain acyl-CoA synthetase
MIPRLPLHYEARPYHGGLHRSVELAPDEDAIHVGGRSFTFREIDGASNSFARALLEIGLGRGDRIAIACGTRIEWVCAVHAASLIGAAAVLINPNWKAAELDHALQVTAPVAIIADAVGMATFADRNVCFKLALDPVQGSAEAGFWDLVMEHSGARLPELEPAQLDEDVLLLFSSGTTGLPKAVRHTHRSIGAAIDSYRSAARLTADDRVQLYLPLFHIFGPISVATSLAVRAPIWLLDRFEPAKVLGQIERDRVTIAFAAGPVAKAFSAEPDLERYDLSSIRYMLWGASPIHVESCAEVSRRTGIEWLPSYAMTEVPMLFMNPVEHPELRRLDSPGVAASDVRARVVDLTTDEDVAPGEVGEILVRSPAVMAGYLPDEANTDAFDNGWYRTGDIGSIDADGWIHLVDRKKEMIKVSGFQVAPAELEAVLLGHPRVVDCAVIGVPDERTGEAPVAIVVPADDLDADEVTTWISSRLVSYKHLRGVIFETEIPRTPAGKVLRRVLGDRFTAEQQAR